MSPEAMEEGFLEALEAGEESIFDAEQAETAVPSTERFTPQALSTASSGWGEWDFDLFWYSFSGVAAQRQVQKLRGALIKEGARGKVRVLPEWRRKKVSQSTYGYEVRVELGEEGIS